MASGVSLRTKLVLFRFDVRDNTTSCPYRHYRSGRCCETILSDAIREILIRKESCSEIYLRIDSIRKLQGGEKIFPYILWYFSFIPCYSFVRVIYFPTRSRFFERASVKFARFPGGKEAGGESDRTRRKERLISGWMGERYGSTQLKLRWNYFPVNRGHVLRSDTSKEAAARYQPCFSRFRPLCTPTCRHSFAFLLYNWHCSVLLRRKQLFRDKCIVAFDRNRKAEEKLERNIGRGF